MSGGGGSQTVKQNADPWSGVQPYLKDAFTQAANLYSQAPPAYYPGQTVAARSPLSDIGDLYSAVQAGTVLPEAAQAQAAGTGKLLAADPYASVSMSGIQHLYNAAQPEANPFFQASLQSAMRPVQQQLQEQILPGIRGGASAAGQFGGSRQGIAEGLASSRAVQSMSDIAAQMGSAAYGQGLQSVAQGAGLGLQAEDLARQSIAQGLALAPQAAQAQLAPGEVLSGLGAQQQAYQQALINADMQRYAYGQTTPYTQLSDYITLLGGAPGNTMTTRTPTSSNPLLSGLGGAATGYTVGSGLGSALGLGAATGGWGALAGGLIGLMGGM